MERRQPVEVGNGCQLLVPEYELSRAFVLKIALEKGCGPWPDGQPVALEDVSPHARPGFPFRIHRLAQTPGNDFRSRGLAHANFRGGGKNDGSVVKNVAGEFRVNHPREMRVDIDEKADAGKYNPEAQDKAGLLPES